MRRELTNRNGGLFYKATTSQKRNAKEPKAWKLKKPWKWSRLKDIKELGQINAVPHSGLDPGAGKENGHKELNWRNW